MITPLNALLGSAPHKVVFLLLCLFLALSIRQPLLAGEVPELSGGAKLTRDTETALTDKCPADASAQLAAAPIMLLNVWLNQRDTDQVLLFIDQQCSQQFLALARELDGLRIDTKKLNRIQLAGESYVDLKQVSGISYRQDELSQRLHMQVDVSLFRSIRIDFDQPYREPMPTQAGLFLNYSLNANDGSDLNELTSSASLEAGWFSELGVLSSQWVFDDPHQGYEHKRLNTRFTRDFPAKAQSLYVGDIRSRSGAWGRGYLLGGISFGRNFSTQPGVNFNPVTELELLNQQPAALQIENQLLGVENTTGIGNVLFGSARRVPAGPVELVNLPVYDNGRYVFSSIDADGNVTSVSEQYFYTLGLLREGVHDYSVSFGVQRESVFGNDYSKLVFSATERYGFSNSFTGEVHLEIGDGASAYGLTGSFSLPYLGALTATLAAGHHGSDVAWSNSLQQLSLSNRYGTLGYSLRYEHLGAEFVHPTDSKEQFNNQRHRYDAGVSLALPWNDHLSLGYSGTESRNSPYSDSIRLSYRMNLPANISADFVGQFATKPTSDWFVGTSFSLSFERLRRAFGLNNKRSASDGQLFAWDGTDASLAATRGKNSELNANLRVSTRARREVNDYGLTISTPVIGNNATNLTGTLNTQYFSSYAGVSHSSGEQSYGAGLSGGLLWLDGNAFLSRSLRSSFALVRLGEEVAGVRVNGLRSNRRGDVVLPLLQPYLDNRVQISAADLPLNAEINQLKQTLRPRFRSGVVLREEVRLLADALVVIHINNRQDEAVPLPYGASVSIVGREAYFPVGDAGTVYLTDLDPVTDVKIRWKQQECILTVTLPDENDGENIVELGPFHCRGIRL